MRKMGWLPDLPDHRDWKYSLHAEYQEALPLPPMVNLISQMSPIEDQGKLGSCVAHATCGALEFLELQTIKQNIIAPENFGPSFARLSRLYVYFNARALDGDTNRDAGTQLRSAVLAIRNAGICRENLWPYDPSKVFDIPVGGAYAEGNKHKVLFGYRIDNSQLIAMKQCLANGFPFIFGMAVYESFMSQQTASTGMVPMPGKGEEMLGGHALCCVGYDDSKKAFIVRNSWSANWGLSGYCFVLYDMLTNTDLASDFWTLRKNGPTS